MRLNELLFNNREVDKQVTKAYIDIFGEEPWKDESEAAYAES